MPCLVSACRLDLYSYQGSYQRVMLGVPVTRGDLEDRDYVEKRIGEFRSRLYVIERQLRADGVNLDRPPVFPGDWF
jgi:hypothetical protein